MWFDDNGIIEYYTQHNEECINENDEVIKQQMKGDND
jgi:hypothetical protein